jgi:tetratricopeptide (TPR) repeat protein
LDVRAGDNDHARELYAEALDLSQQVGERWMAMNVLVGLSYVSEDIDAGPALEEMVGVLRQTGNRMMQIVWLRQLAHRRRLEGDLDGAKRAVDEASEIVKEEGTPEATVLGRYILGSHLDEAERDYAGALREFQGGLRAAHSQGSEWETTFGLTGVAHMLANSGENERAALLLGAATAMQEKVGMHPQGPRAEAQRNVFEVLGSALGGAELQRLRTEGGAMSLDEAVALATETAK